MRILEQLGAIDPTLSLFVGLNNILGIRPLLHFASSTLKDELLPLLATGRELAAFALTETGAGSNPQAIVSQAIPQPHGGWLLQGKKYGVVRQLGRVLLMFLFENRRGLAALSYGKVLQDCAKGPKP